VESYFLGSLEARKENFYSCGLCFLRLISHKKGYRFDDVNQSIMYPVHFRCYTLSVGIGCSIGSSCILTLGSIVVRLTL
jgi:hypothetical protein